MTTDASTPTNLTDAQAMIAHEVFTEIGSYQFGSDLVVRLNLADWPEWADTENPRLWGWPVVFDLPQSRYIIRRPHDHAPPICD